MKYILGLCSFLLVVALPVYALMGDERVGGYMDNSVFCPDKTGVDRGVNVQDAVATLVPSIVEDQRKRRKWRSKSDAVQ